MLQRSGAPRFRVGPLRTCFVVRLRSTPALQSPFRRRDLGSARAYTATQYRLGLSRKTINMSVMVLGVLREQCYTSAMCTAVFAVFVWAVWFPREDTDNSSWIA